MNEYIKRGMISFAISSFAGLTVNLVIDILVNLFGSKGFASISPDFAAQFPTTVMAGYVNVLLYGIIGAVFAVMTFVFEQKKMGVLIQWAVYFAVTGSVCVAITVFVWQLHKIPKAFIGTICGYLATYVIIGIAQFKKLKEDVRIINDALGRTTYANV